MSNLRKIEKLTGGKALLEKRPADNYFPAEHWFLQTANGGTFASMSRQEVLCVALDVISEAAAEQSVHPTCGESAPLSALSTPEADTPAEVLSTPPTSG